MKIKHDFTTSYFAGFVPYPTEKSNQLNPENSYVIAAYVGYDQNKAHCNIFWQPFYQDCQMI